jgi:acetylornithine deacetylase
MDLMGVLDKLGRLVAFDTQNPPRALDADAPIFSYVKGMLGPDFSVETTDHGKGRVSMLAVRGTPSLLFNVHLDTVPVIAGSRFPPLELTVDSERAYGRGACDIKGAAACLLEVADLTAGPMALLFTTDEEGASGCCIKEFLAAGRGERFAQAVVAEPTGCLAIASHRGYLSVKGRFAGNPGHSSEPRALRDNALNKLSTWVAAAVQAAAQMEAQGRRPCFNVGEVRGGIKSNVIAEAADIHWSARLSPGDSNQEFLDEMASLEHGDAAEWHVPFSGPPLPTGGMGTVRAEAFIRERGLEAGEAVDFWTEASLFAAAGLPAVVLGPGNIAQAHAVDEWVSLEQLRLALDIYTRLVENDD